MSDENRIRLIATQPIRGQILDKNGIVLFGSHTTAKKVSIENYNFKAISVENLKDLDVDSVINSIKSKLN